MRFEGVYSGGGVGVAGAYNRNCYSISQFYSVTKLTGPTLL